MKNIKFYKSISDINVLSFFNIVDTNDFRYLIKKFDIYDNENFKLNINQEIKANELFDIIFKDYLNIISTKNTLNIKRKDLEISILEHEYDVISYVLNEYEKFKEPTLLLCINDLEIGLKIDINKNLDLQIKKIISKCKSIKMLIKIKKIDNFSKQKKSTNQKIKFVPGLYEDAYNLEQILKLNYQIDLQKTSLSKWCVYNKRAKSINNNV